MQGTAAPGERAARIAKGAQKIVTLGPDALREACAGSQVILGPDSSQTILNDPKTVVRGVGADGNRRFLSLVDWVTEHFATSDKPGPNGHGFIPDNVTAGTAYYVLQNGPVALIVLDSVNPAGFPGAVAPLEAAVAGSAGNVGTAVTRRKKVSMASATSRWSASTVTM